MDSASGITCLFGFSVLLNRELLTDRTKYSNCCGMLNGGWEYSLVYGV